MFWKIKCLMVRWITSYRWIVVGLLATYSILLCFVSSKQWKAVSTCLSETNTPWQTKSSFFPVVVFFLGLVFQFMKMKTCHGCMDGLAFQNHFIFGAGKEKILNYAWISQMNFCLEIIKLYYNITSTPKINPVVFHSLWRFHSYSFF